MIDFGQARLGTSPCVRVGESKMSTSSNFRIDAEELQVEPGGWVKYLVAGGLLGEDKSEADERK
jgi:hypothetical protein